MNSGRPGLAARADITRLLGQLDDEDIAQLLAMQPTVAELEDAAAWLQGVGDVASRAGHPMTPRIEGILEIVDRDDEEDLYPH
jgi:hypothetical protein